MCALYSSHVLDSVHLARDHVISQHVFSGSGSVPVRAWASHTRIHTIDPAAGSGNKREFLPVSIKTLYNSMNIVSKRMRCL